MSKSNFLSPEGYEFKVDRVSGNLIMISRIHHETHDKLVYDVGNVFLTVANSEVRYIAWTTPADVYPHVAYEVTVTGNCTLELLDGLTYSGGTALIAFNRNLNGTDKAGIFVHTPTAPSGGASKFPILIPGGGKHGGTGGASFPEKVFQPSTKYALKVTNVSGGACHIGMSIVYYESSVV